MCTSFTHLFVFRLVIKMKQNTHKVSKSLGETEIEIVSVYYTFFALNLGEISSQGDEA